MPPRSASGRIVTFGEALIRLSPRDHGRLHDSTEFAVTVGGSEANVAVGARQLGMDACWVSCLPRNPLGRRVERFLAGLGVDTTEVVWTDEGRVGLYFVEHGSYPQPTRLLYDRAQSSFVHDGQQYDLQRLLQGAAVFHTSGVTPALGTQPAKAVHEAVIGARKLGVPVRFDLNYRSHLWTQDDAVAFYTEIPRRGGRLVLLGR